MPSTTAFRLVALSALAVMAAVLVTMPGATQAVDENMYDTITAGIQGQNLILFDSATTAANVQPARMCVNQDLAEPLFAPETDSAIGAVREYSNGGKLVVLASNYFVNGAVQLGASDGAPSALGQLLLNLVEWCSPNAFSDTILVIDQPAYTQANDVIQWFIDRKTNGLEQIEDAFAMPMTFADSITKHVIISSADKYQSSHNFATWLNHVNGGQCLILTSNPNPTAPGTNSLLSQFTDVGIYFPRGGQTGAAASASGYAVGTSQPSGTFHCCNAATDCNGQGSCNNDETCTCTGGYSGADCTTDPICVSSSCSNNGNCDTDGSCICTGGWTGAICDSPPICVSSSCAGHGSCDTDGSCICTGGYGGADCTEPICVHTACSGNGSCDIDGSCICTGGYTGNDCGGPRYCDAGGASNACSGNGNCDAIGDCTCTGGYTGTDCSGPRYCDAGGASNGCSGNGSCDTDGNCDCTGGYTGSDCRGPRPCDAGCSGRGSCDTDGTCICTGGWAGDQCELVPDGCHTLDAGLELECGGATTPAMHACADAATTQILELSITSSFTTITASLASGANSPGRTFTSAVVRVPTATGADCDHDILTGFTCDNDCACTLDISGTDLAASCTVDASSGSFTATLIVNYEDAQTDFWGNAAAPYTHTTEASTTVISADQDITAAVGTGSAHFVNLQLLSNVIAPAADATGDATMTINFKLVSASEVTAAAASNPVMVDGTVADTSDDLSSIAVAANGAAYCGAATCSHNYVLTLASLATICNFDGTVTMHFAPTCAGGECDPIDDAFTATISIAQPFNSKAICAPDAAGAADLVQSLTATTAAALVTSTSEAANLVWESFVHEIGDTAAKELSALTSVKMGLYTASDTCDASLATLQEVHDGTAITAAGTALDALTFTTPTDDATHTITLGLTLDNVGNLASLGVAGADESRKTAFQTNYRSLICTVVVRTVSSSFGSRRRLTVTTASSSQVKSGAAGGEVVAFLPPSQAAAAAAGNYMVDSATIVLLRFATTDADLLQEPAIREHIRTAVSASLAHAAGISASQIVVTGIELVEGADGNHHVHVTTALVLHGSDTVVVAQHESVTTRLAAATGLGDSIELKLSEAGVNNMQHASTTVSRDAALPDSHLSLVAIIGIIGVAVVMVALLAPVAFVAKRRLSGSSTVQPKQEKMYKPQAHPRERARTTRVARPSIKEVPPGTHWYGLV